MRLETKASYRILLVATHPVQYAAPLFRQLATDPRVQITVAYASLAGAQVMYDPGFGREVTWDIPLLDGYGWLRLKRPVALSAARLVASDDWDAVVMYVSYQSPLFWGVLLSAKRRRIPLLFGNDAVSLDTRLGGRIRPHVKALLLPPLLRLADVALAYSTASAEFLRSLGVNPARLIITPYSTDIDWWQTAATYVDRTAVRRTWNIPPDAPVFLFCAKLQPWKAPLELLKAFPAAAAAGAYLVFAGDGPLRDQLAATAALEGIAERIRFLGFVNQSRLPAVYRSCDTLVLPSSYEPFGLVVNEAMLCGCAAVVSDKVGAGRDMVIEGQTGFVYPSGNVSLLAMILERLTKDPVLLEKVRRAAKEHVLRWTPQRYGDSLIEALTLAVGGTATPGEAPSEGQRHV
jgi:glycosyltransferase involved in cell wall biosynthesis